MKNTLFIALTFIKEYFLVSFTYYIIIGAYAFILLLTIVTLALKLTLNKNLKLKAFNLLVFACGVIFANAVLVEIIYYKQLFTSFLDIVIFSSAFLILTLLSNALLSSISPKCKKVKIVQEVQRKQLESAPQKKAVEVISCVEEGATVYGGYLNVDYLKGLLTSLKGKELEFDDEKWLEDFEVYLLNFVNRQPNTIERVKLSEDISSLIKKLAQYEVI